jgi:hypothetical protein
MMNSTQIKALIEAARALYDCIPPGEFPTGGIPNGHLYARLMSSCDFDTYNTLLATLQNANLIEIKNHYITRIEPT